MQMRSSTPGWGLAAALLAVCALALPASAQPRGKAKADKNGAGSRADKNDKGAPPPAAPPKDDDTVVVSDDKAPGAKVTVKGGSKKDAPKTYDFNALDLNGRMRTPQLLYFLDRASEELERASLERRSFIPAMVHSIDESDL